MIFVGIDPGTTGAIAAVDELGQLVALHDMPRKRIGASADANAQWRVDGAELYCVLKDIIADHSSARVCYEDVQPYNGVVWIVVQMMGTKYAVETILDCMPQVQALPVPATQWKRFFGLRKDTTDKTKSKQKINAEFKAKSRALAVHLWPEAMIRTVEHTDRAEAALMAEYDRRRYAGIGAAGATGDIFAKPDHNPRIRRGRIVQVGDESDIPFGTTR